MLFFLALGTGPVAGEPPVWSGSPDQAVVVKTVEGTMRYDRPEFEVAPGAKVRLTLENADELQHNLVLLRPDDADRNGLAFAMAIWNEGEAAMARGWLPADGPRVLAATRLLDPHAAEDLYFVAPEQAGDYPYVCTVPGHAMIMNGMMKVRTATPPFQTLSYRLYEGDWSKLPDFSTLTPTRSGDVPGKRITLEVAGKTLPDKFALVFDGVLEAPETDEYEFFLGSDDGSRLVIDGEGELEADGIHPFKTVSKKLRLEKGTHTVQVQYFEGGGHENLALAAKRKKGGLLALSVEKPGGVDKGQAPLPVIPLRPERVGEAVLYRNFIDGSTPRGIAVGYPGGVNVCWDANTCNLALLWRGGFMDAGRHWTGRGPGNQPPMGFDVAKPAQGMSLQVLESPEETWEPFSRAQVKYERDKPQPEREITIDVRHPDYRFRGYRLDGHRFPTFLYEFRGVRVEDRFDPEPGGKTEALRRSVKIAGAPGTGTFFRVAQGISEPDGEGWGSVGPVAVRVEGVSPVIRSGAGGREWLVPVDGPAEFRVHYRWLTEIGGRETKQR
jgi:azurin